MLERHASFGGAATVYRHGALTMEAALHETDGDTVYGANGPFSRLGLTGFAEVRYLYRSVSDLEELGARGPAVLVGLILSGRLFELLVHSRRTLHQRLEAVLGDDEIPKFILGAPFACFDDDPCKLSYLGLRGVWTRYVDSIPVCEHAARCMIIAINLQRTWRFHSAVADDTS